MKTSRTAATILLGIVFFFPVTATAQTWEWQLPLPQGNRLKSADWADASTAMAVGDKGTVLLTYDGGASWTVKHLVTGDVGLTDVCFIDPNTATCVGANGVIIRTTDGGDSWTEQTSGITSSLNGVNFVDINTGYAVGHYGIILKTTNGGATWTPQISNSSEFLDDVSFSNANTGCVVGSGGTILTTTDGGANWTPRTSGTIQTLLGVCFADPDTGMAVGLNETALLTTDGGATWTPQVFPARPPGDIFTLRDVCMIDGRHAWLAGYFQDWASIDIGYVLQTANGGVSWERAYSDDGGYNWLWAVSFADRNNGIAVGDLGTIHRTTDGGANWSKVGGAVMDLEMGGVDFFDADHGVAVSSSGHLGGIGEVYYTNDGGSVWHSVRASDGYGPLMFFDVTYASESVVWAVGLGSPYADIYGTLFKSTDGGVSYHVYAYQICSPPLCWVEHYLWAISFFGPDDGVAVGDRGIVWTVKDGVVNDLASGTSRNLRGVSMPDSVTVIAVGDTGTVMVSTNGGTTWTPKNSGVKENLRAVSFVTPQTGTAVGDLGTILRTTDGGETWTRQESGTSNWLYGVDFLDEDNGVAVGGVFGWGGAVALVTTDGGESWRSEPLGVLAGLRDVALTPGRMVAVGEGQTILNRKCSVVGVEEQPRTATLRLPQNHPNPFNSATTIRFSIQERGRVSLNIYNVAGQLVKTLVDTELSPQPEGFSAGWNGDSDTGDTVSSGVYFCRLTAGGRTVTKKLVLLK